MEQETVTQLVHSALRGLYQEDIKLLQLDVSERAITHKLAEHIQKLLPDNHYQVDCEYNRDGNRPKRLTRIYEEIKEMFGSVPPEIFEESGIPKFIFPDIVIHKRDSKEFNACVIELKKVNSEVNRKYDREKLVAYTSEDEYNYTVGLFIELNTGKDAHHHKVKVEVYQNGKKAQESKTWKIN